MATPSARDRLIVALDFGNAAAAAALAEKLHGRVAMFKVGSELFTAEGPVLARFLVSARERVFLDLKWHDIPNTVRAAAREAAQMGVRMVDVHASGGRKMMEAAIEGVRQGAAAGKERPLVLAVTILTSLGSADLEEVGMGGSAEDAVARLAKLAQQSGLDGVVASPREIAAVRRVCGPRFLVVTPGIRLPAAASNDQTRIATPAAAIQAGADFLVVGRPITAAPDPVAAAGIIAAEMEQALPSRSPATSIP